MTESTRSVPARFWGVPSDVFGGSEHMDSRIGTQVFIALATRIHGALLFDYSRVVFRALRAPIEIKCPVHGWVHLTPEQHMMLESGCVDCEMGRGTDG